MDAADAFLDGDLDTGKRLLRDYLNATGALAAVARGQRQDEKGSRSSGSMLRCGNRHDPQLDRDEIEVKDFAS